MYIVWKKITTYIYVPSHGTQFDIVLRNNALRATYRLVSYLLDLPQVDCVSAEGATDEQKRMTTEPAETGNGL